MALIKCRECGKEISDQAFTCPNCGYPMKLPDQPVPSYRDITWNYDIDLNERYYDNKNKREISFGEYLTAKERYEEERKRASEACYQRTQELIVYINNPNELEEVKILRFYFTLANENLSREYSEEGLNIMRNYIKNYNERKKEKSRSKKKR